ncbi:kinase-like domain-containing protein [Linnemannia elongata]|nr:kinase-like domain-containing protein [Linnemannia elongata]
MTLAAQDSKMTSKGKQTQQDTQLEHTSEEGEAMDVDQQQQDESIDGTDDSDTDSTISTSLPSSFLSAGLKPLEQRRVSTSVLATPLHTRNPMLLEGERAAAMVPRRRVMKTPPPTGDDDFISTPSKIHGSTAPLVKPSFARPGSLLSKMGDKGSLLGKHPQTPSPGEETLRSKGFKSLSSKENDAPVRILDFSKPSTPEPIGDSIYSPVLAPNFGTPPGTPRQNDPLSFPFLTRTASVNSPFGNDGENNPFLGSPKPKARFEMDYLSESQWYSEYPHHLTEEYLEDLFRLDRRVMFSKGKAGSRLYPDYLTTNFYVNEIVLGAGEHADVLKVQSKNSKEFYAVKRLLRTVQGAMERKRYLNEVRNMWRIEKSPNVLQLLEAWEQKGKIYMRMELCKLGSLKSALLAQKKYGGFDEKRTWKCLSDLASGLRAIHDSNIIHLDIKPENIFITAAGALKIGDFGHSITYPVEKKDITEGDKFYMAQELLNGHCGKYSDIFSLGMTIYEMITNRSGDLPGEGRHWHELRDGDFSLENITDRNRNSAEGALDTPPNELSSTTVLTTSSTTSSLTSVMSASPLSGSSVSSPFESVLGSSILKSSQQRVFSEDLIELMKEMMQPDYLMRPSASSILSHPKIQRILSKRNDATSKGARSEEAMSGLLLQSV